MHDRPTQLTLGIFLSTGFYCLLVLRVVGNFEDVGSKPHFSVLGAIILTVVSMAMLIIFVHHVAISIQAPNIVADVALDLNNSIERLFPGQGDKSNAQVTRITKEDQEFEIASLGEIACCIKSTLEGYIQAIDTERLIDLAVEESLVLSLRSHPGAFIAKGTPIADVWTNPKRTFLKDELKKSTEIANGAYIVGNSRTPRQDLECAIEELTEVAVRSLSPGINDPFTAINCIDRLGASLGKIAQKDQKSNLHRHKKLVRLIVRDSGFEDALNCAFNQIRQYARNNISVIIRMLESLSYVAENIRRESDGRALEKHAKMILKSSSQVHEISDKEDLAKRFDRFMELLAAKQRQLKEITIE